MSVKKIGLCMIVKDEAHVIERCLRSVRPLIDYICIEDTGSTDGTQALIRAFMEQENLPGEVFEEPWRDFATNRSIALERLREQHQVDYALIIDADDVAELSDGFDPSAFRAMLVADQYGVRLQELGGTQYRRCQIVSNRKAYRYRGVLHEFIEGPPDSTTNFTDAFHIVRRVEGNRSRNPHTYLDDALVLEQALKVERDPFLIARYTFYLGQSWRDAGEPEKAIDAYLKRVDLGYWDEERYLSLVNAARLAEGLGHDDDDVLALYERAQIICPYRAEALWSAAKLCRIKGLHQKGYQLGRQGITLTMPDGLFIDGWVYDYAMKDEFAIHAYGCGHYQESLDVCLQLLGGSKLPVHDRERVAANAQFAAAKLGVNRRVIDPTEFPEAGSPVLSPAAPGIRRSRSIPGRVSIITPTYQRGRLLRAMQKRVRDQDYPDIEWLILDDSPMECESCEDLAAPNVIYHRITEKMSIGEKRNWLVERAKGEIIVHFDDDDFYAPGYISAMVAALCNSDADLMNLRGWYLYDVRSRFLGYCNLEHKIGPHYHCTRDGVSMTMLTEESNRSLSHNHLGYGFSYAYRRSLWEKAPFPDRDHNEDGEFSLKAIEQGARLAGMHDTQGLCLHYLHQGSSSSCFSQYHLPGALLHRLFPEHDESVMSERST